MSEEEFNFVNLVPQVIQTDLSGVLGMINDGTLTFPSEEIPSCEGEPLSRSESRYVIAMLCGVPPKPQPVHRRYGTTPEIVECVPWGLTTALSPAIAAAVRFCSPPWPSVGAAREVRSVSIALADGEMPPSLKAIASLEGKTMNTLPTFLRNRFRALLITLVVFPKDVPVATASGLGWMAW